MKAALLSLVEELRCMKREGHERVCVSGRNLQRLEQAVESLARQAGPAVTPSPSAAPAEPTSSSLPASARSAPAKAAPAEASDLPSPPVVELPEGDKASRYAWLRERVLGCEECRSHVKPGKHVVIGSGNLDSPIFFCGEAPGADEETQGEVFVGPAGQLLTRIIKAMGLERDEVYIGNIMNWRPEVAVGNRPPTPDEMAFCLPYLRAQIAVVQPKLIVALGKTAVDGLLGPDPNRRMGQVRGRWFDFEGTLLMPTFHPSYLLRNQTQRAKRQVWEDMLKVMERVEMPISEKQRGYFT